MQFLLCLSTLLVTVGAQFSIDYEKDTFVMDGKPFRYVSGSMHYFRCPRELWRDRLRKMRQAGLNAVSTYIEWSQHEITPGKYNFEGERNVTEFIQTAAEEGLYVIVRPGPYICAEREMGGLPPWLLRDPTIKLRSSDGRYLRPVERWMNIILKYLSPMLYGNGGPIILLQVENEYGSYPACDFKYLTWLRDLFLRHVNDKAVLFTTDGNADYFLKCGKIPGVYATVDFGSGVNVSTAFEAQRKYEPRGPLVNSEYYPGWLTHWGEALAQVQADAVAKTLQEMLDINANINFYMFHGGSNFGFTAGANFGNSYQSDITSYDYDAPMTEAGDLTEKYNSIKSILSEYFPNTNNRTIQNIAPKGDYGELHLTYIANLLTPKVRSILGKTSSSLYPRTFEALGNYYGYVLYETKLPENVPSESTIVAESIRDRGTIVIDNIKAGTLLRETNLLNATIKTTPNATLGVLVENLGRINYGAYNNDTKGIGNVTLNDSLLKNWKMTAFPFNSLDNLLTCKSECLSQQDLRFFATKFMIPTNISNEFLPDTFIDVRSLLKGLIFINGHNLGRYWTSRGPQFSLYVPGVWLNKAPLENTIIVFDEKVQTENIRIKFSKTPIWGIKKFKYSG